MSFRDEFISLFYSHAVEFCFSFFFVHVIHEPFVYWPNFMFTIPLFFEDGEIKGEWVERQRGKPFGVSMCDIIEKEVGK